MIRKTFTALAAVAALSLAGCASGGDTASSGSTPSDAAASQPSDAGASGTGAGSASAGSAGSAAASGEDSGDDGGDEAAGSADAGEDGSAEQTKVTLGGGDLDAQTATWFSAFCDGMSPLAEGMAGLLPSSTSDPAEMQQSAVQYFNTVGDAMSDTANKLESLPPPTFDQGSEVASKMVAGMAQAGPAFKEAASKIAAADVSSQEDLDAAMSEVTTTLGSTMDSVNLDQYELADKTEEDLAKLPACAPLFDSGSGSDGSEPTG